MRRDDKSARGETAAERDARAIADRAAEDERAADELRSRIRDGYRPRMEPDESIRPQLAPGEIVVETRQAVVAERVDPRGGSTLLTGRLYVTTERIVLLGLDTIDLPLESLDEVAVAGERILITVRDGSGLRLDAGWPRLLRVQIAAAQAAAQPWSQRASK